MKSVSLFQSISRTAGIGFLSLAVSASAAWAQAPAAPVPNKGDTAWMLVSTLLVLMMSIPGLALFYGGLVRTKNMLSVLSQVFMIVSLVSILWVTYGYSLGDHARLDRSNLLEWRGYSGVRLYGVPDDLRLHHARTDRRRLR
jgi:Amt family ammonium transporter